jgi:hypothetical protein
MKKQSALIRKRRMSVSEQPRDAVRTRGWMKESEGGKRKRVLETKTAL